MLNLVVHVVTTGLWTIITRGGVSSTRGLGPNITARGQSIGISIGMLPQNTDYV